MNRLFYTFFSFFVFFVIGKEYLTINEETLLITAFFLFFYFSYVNLSQLIYEFLTDRSNQIFDSINQALTLKRSNLAKLKTSYSTLVSCSNSLLLVFSFVSSLRDQKKQFWEQSSSALLFGATNADLAILLELDLLTLKYYNTIKLSQVLAD